MRDIFDSELFYFLFKSKKIGLDLENVYLFIINDSKIKSEKPQENPQTLKWRSKVQII